MPFDPHAEPSDARKLERQQQCLAFCMVLHEIDLVTSDLASLLAKQDPPAAHSTIAAVEAVYRSIPAVWLPLEPTKMICDFAFGEPSNDDKFRNCIEKQRRNYSRLPGDIVLQGNAMVGERVRASRYPRFNCQHYSVPPCGRGTIVSLDCDGGTEIAVKWDDGSVWGNSMGGLQCGKKGNYRLVYDS